MMNLAKKSEALKVVDNLTPSVKETFVKAFSLYRAHLDLETYFGEFLHIDGEKALFSFFETSEDHQNLKSRYYETMTLEALRTYIVALPHKNA